jgi:hypothetical protein
MIQILLPSWHRRMWHQDPTQHSHRHLHERRSERTNGHTVAPPQHRSSEHGRRCDLRMPRRNTFLVSSAVLRLSSGFFRRQLDGPFREGQVSRSAASPQRIPSEEENSYALHRLLCLLHHQRDPYIAQQHLTDVAEDQLGDRITAAARRLQDLAVVIDYYGCSESLERVIASLFNDFTKPRTRDKMTFKATVHAAAAAHRLGDSRYFRLFTKRLVTDFTEPLGDVDFGGGPQNAMALELNRQTKRSWDQLRDNVDQLAMCVCTVNSGTTVTSHNIGVDRSLRQKLSFLLLPPGNS